MPRRLRFAANDPLISDLIKERIEGWQDRLPSSQFQQYGPIDRYLNQKFNGGNFMVKPQALFRSPIEEADSDLLLEYGTGQDDPVPDDPREAERLVDLRQEVEAGDISIDSTHRGYIARRGMDSTKRFPDFAVCECSRNGDKDKVRIIFEVGSISRTATRNQIEGAKESILDQMVDYLNFIGDSGDRWETFVVGVVLLGTSVAFIVPRQARNNSASWKVWKEKSTHADGWYPLYGRQFRSFMEQAKNVDEGGH